MSVIVHGQRIPVAKFSQFHDILCDTGGRYLQNPYSVQDFVVVHYETPNHAALSMAWARCNTQVREILSNQPWRCALRRVGFPV